MSEESRILFFDPDEVSIESRIAHFDHPPNEEELGTCLGEWLAGGSPNKLVNDEQTLTVSPPLIPVKLAMIWMYFVLASMAIITVVYSPTSDRMLWGMLLMAGLFIIPAMGVVCSMMNDMMGDAPYLKLNKLSGVVELPRVQMTLPKSQLREIIFLDRFSDGIRFWQVALLCEDQSNWTYIHLYNEAESGTGMHLWGCKEQYEQLAEHLGIGVRRLNFDQKDSAALDANLSADKAGQFG